MTCSIPRCRASATLTLMGHGLCDAHWNIHAEQEIGLPGKCRCPVCQEPKIPIDSQPVESTL